MRGELIGFLKNRNISYATDVSAKALSTFRIGGVCSTVVRPLCLQELMDVCGFCALRGIPYVAVGRGSNLLFGDGRIETVLVKTEALDCIMQGEDFLIAQCGVSLPHLARKTAAVGYADLAFAAGIPGSIGGAVYMNAGAFGQEISSLVEWVEAYLPIERRIRTYFNEELGFCYRNSVFQSKNEVILRTKLRFSHRLDKNLVFDVMRQNFMKRSNSQPLHLPSVGSAFRRPRADIAVGRLLEELGLKGLRCGDAAVSEKHAGFIVNLGNATCADVKKLVETVQKTVEEKTEFRLVPEFEEII